MAATDSSPADYNYAQGPADRALVRDALLNRAFKPGEGWRKDGHPFGWMLDCRDILLSARILPAISRLLCEAIADLHPDFVAGSGLSGAPLTAGMVSASRSLGKSYDGLLIRDKPKAYGLRRQVEGPSPSPGARVVIVDDLVNSGDTAIHAAAILSGYGVNVAGVAAIVEFDPDAAVRLASRGLPTRTLFSLAGLGISPLGAANAVGGAQAWRYGGINRADDDVPVSRPLFCNDRVIVGSNRGFVAAITTQGTLIWKVTVGPSEKSPAAVHFSPVALPDGILAGADNGLLTCLSPDTGGSRWMTRCGDRVGAGAVSDQHGRVFTSATDLPDAGALACVSASDGRSLWRAKMSGYAHAAPALSADEKLVIAADNSGAVRCFRSHDGTPLWSYSVAAAVKADLATDAEGRCFCCGFDGYVTALDVVSGTLLWRKRLARRLYSAPLPTPAGLIVGADEYAFCLHPDSGRVEWIARVEGQVRGRIALLPGETLVFGCTDSTVRFVSSKGVLKGLYRTGGPVTSGVSLLDGHHVLISSSDGFLSAIRPY